MINLLSPAVNGKHRFLDLWMISLFIKSKILSSFGHINVPESSTGAVKTDEELDRCS